MHNKEILMVQTLAFADKNVSINYLQEQEDGYRVPFKITIFQEISQPLWATGSVCRGESRMLVRLRCV